MKNFLWNILTEIVIKHYVDLICCEFYLLYSSWRCELFHKTCPINLKVLYYFLKIWVTLVLSRGYRSKTITLKPIFCKRTSKGVSLLRKSKKNYFANLDKKNITDNKRFWKTVKPFLSKKFIFLNKWISPKEKTTLY